MQITYQDLMDLARRYEGFDEIDAQFLKHQPAHVVDNFVLECAVFQAEDEAEDELSAELMGLVYSAAKVVFGRNPGMSLVFDVQSAYSGFGSPWTCEVDTPELYVLSFARRFNETDECRIEGCSDATLRRLESTVDMLYAVGISLIDIQEDAGYIAYETDDPEDEDHLPSQVRRDTVMMRTIAIAAKG